MDQFDPAADPFPHDRLGPVDEWSMDIYRAMTRQLVVAEGVWTRLEPGCLLLSVERLKGEAIDPIVMDTDDEELTLSFGGWHTHLPEEAVDALGAVEEAVALINRWISGELKTLIFWKADGTWAGSVTVQRGERVQDVADCEEWLSYSQPTRAELRTPCKADWAHFANDNGRWRVASPSSPYVRAGSDPVTIPGSGPWPTL